VRQGEVLILSRARKGSGTINSAAADSTFVVSPQHLEMDLLNNLTNGKAGQVLEKFGGNSQGGQQQQQGYGNTSAGGYSGNSSGSAAGYGGSSNGSYDGSSGGYGNSSNGG